MVPAFCVARVGLLNALFEESYELNALELGQRAERLGQDVREA